MLECNRLMGPAVSPPKSNWREKSLSFVHSLLILISLPFTGTALTPGFTPSGVEGTWQGSLDVGSTKLLIVLHINRTPTGSLKGSIDSPDQQAFGLPIDTVTFANGKLRTELKKLGAVYEGIVDSKFESIKGKFTQSGHEFDLDLKRTESGPKPTPVNRPQIPKVPYPYDAEDVAFENKAARVTLAGTLTMPKSKGPFPAVILISGSGANKRDEEVFQHPVFLVLADYLTRHGFAVLRYDKRGVGKSTGSYAAATTSDFASDARAGIEYLKSCPEIDHERIGLIGHSEGGLIAPMVAAGSKDVKFIVIMAGPGIDGGKIIILQTGLIMAAEGATKDQITKSQTKQKRYITAIRTSKDNADLSAKLDAIIAQEKAALTPAELKTPGLTASIEQNKTAYNSPWMREFVNLDPVTALKKVTCPVLVLNGEKDLQVPPLANLPVIQAALMAGGNKDFTVRQLPGLNHLFQPCTTGAPSEYGKIETTLAPAALSVITDWLKAKTAE
jgi:pimeloyl-ACP methyl ester carboxylesterase